MPKTRLRCSLIASLALVLLAGQARAADDPQRAKELFQQGTTYFDVGQFDKAIEAWQEGYKAKPDPGFLYNIAQAYRLSGDAQKAIFFYKGFLRYSPKAANRADVEQKIALLQKQVNEGDKGRQATPPPPASPPRTDTTPPPPPPPAAPPVAAGPPPLAPPFPAAQPPYDPPPVNSPPAVPLPDTIVSTPPPGPPTGVRHWDLAVAMGTDFWASGPSRDAQPSFAFTMAGGYTFGGPSARALRFRLGAHFGYTFLDEGAFRETLTSFLIEPSVRIRLGQKLSMQAGLGIGVLGISGIKGSSSLAVPGKIAGSQGSVPFLELRPSVTLEYALLPSLSLFVNPAIAYSPKKQYFNAAISRPELLFGLAFRF